jgi:hypothetical protein
MADAPFAAARPAPTLSRTPHSADRPIWPMSVPQYACRAVATTPPPGLRPAIAVRSARRFRAARARLPRRPGRPRTSRWCRPSPNCRCNLAPPRRPPSTPKARSRSQPAPPDMKPSESVSNRLSRKDFGELRTTSRQVSRGSSRLTCRSATSRLPSRARCAILGERKVATDHWCPLFSKFVLLFSTRLSRTSESYGHWQIWVASGPFDSNIRKRDC